MIFSAKKSYDKTWRLCERQATKTIYFLNFLYVILGYGFLVFTQCVHICFYRKPFQKQNIVQQHLKPAKQPDVKSHAISRYTNKHASTCHLLAHEQTCKHTPSLGAHTNVQAHATSSHTNRRSSTRHLLISQTDGQAHIISSDTNSLQQSYIFDKARP